MNIQQKDVNGEVFRQIQSAALKLFQDKGFDAVSVEDICKAADLSKPTFYNHILSKESLFLSFYQVEEEDLSFLDRPRSDGNWMACLLLFYRFFFTVFSFYGRKMFTKIVQLGLTSEENPFGLAERYRGLLLEFLQQGQNNGTIASAQTPEDQLQTLSSFFYGYCYYYCNQPSGIASMDEMSRQMQELLENRTGRISA